MKERWARWGYAALLRLLTPFYLLRLWRRGRAEPMYRQFMGERLGFYKTAAPTRGWIWVHAVSLGETRAAAALITELRAQKPSMRLLLTHSTATGRETGRGLLEPGDAQAWLPYDTPGAVRRFLRHWQPSVGVLMETEIWPGLQHAAARISLPMVLANARLSARSQRRGERFGALLHPAARALSVALAQTDADAQRLRASGVPRVEVMGNLKYDLQPDASLLRRGRDWRVLLARPVLLFAVSREGEEAMLLDAWRAVPSVDKPLLLIVPRHPQRFDEVAGLIESAGLTLARRSEWQAPAPGGSQAPPRAGAIVLGSGPADDQEDLPPADVLSRDAWLGDSMREMALYYGLADVALLGGSFAPLGGQNLIEAAACGCPVVMGPHTFNFAEAAELAGAAGAALRVADMREGLAQGLALCSEGPHRTALAARAQKFAGQHRGAAARMATAVLACAQSGRN